MTYSALDFITKALRILQVLGEGVEASNAQGAEGLGVLNDMIELWAIDGQVSILAALRTTKALTANQQRYTIGTGGDIAITRPSFLDAAGVIPDNSLTAAQQTELPMYLHTAATWAKKVLKSFTSTYPTEVYYDESFSATTERGNLDVWPILTTGTVTLVLYTPIVIGQFADLSTTYKFAPGYSEAIKLNLALALAPRYGRPLRTLGTVVGEAARTKALLEIQNTTVPVLRGDSALAGRGGFDMRTGR